MHVVYVVDVDVGGGLGLGFCQMNLSVFPRPSCEYRGYHIDHKIKTFRSPILVVLDKFVLVVKYCRKRCHILILRIFGTESGDNSMPRRHHC